MESISQKWIKIYDNELVNVLLRLLRLDKKYHGIFYIKIKRSKRIKILVLKLLKYL